jgi:hypothetical protein
MSWFSMPVEMSCRSGDAATVAAKAVVYPAESDAPKTDWRTAPPRSRCRSAVPDALPARCTGTEPVSE